MFAIKEMDFSQYEQLLNNSKDASDFFRKVERDSTLIGCVGLEDKPKHNV